MSVSAPTRVLAQIPEWAPFRASVATRRPDWGTACTAWTVLHKGLEQVDAAEPFSFRLRTDGRDDVVVHGGPDGGALELAPPEGGAVVVTDAAARVLLMWGRQPNRPGRLVSRAGPEELGRARAVLSGY